MMVRILIKGEITSLKRVFIGGNRKTNLYKFSFLQVSRMESTAYNRYFNDDKEGMKLAKTYMKFLDERNLIKNPEKIREYIDKNI